MKQMKHMKAGVFDEARRMKKEMDNALHEVFEKRSLFPAGKSAKEPVSEVSVKDDNVIVVITLPGMERRDIQLEVSDKHIEVMAVRKHDVEVRKKHSYSRSVNASKFYRLLPLPAKVDAERTIAGFKDGVLKITVPIKENKKLPEERSKAKKVIVR